MSYTVLARRYRSSTFDEVVGQVHVAQTLKRAIESGRIAHAFMFCGTRGTGKTSMARILAKALNCEKFDKPTTTPCGKCRSCEAIARGDDIDVIEIDAASNRGIDEVRRIIENSRLAPARSRYKVYIIDEVHAMSKDAFNALLKVLEEPASHVKFVLATTEAEKVLATILSRCQRYDFHNIPVREIAAHLNEICKREGVKAQEDALMLIARAGNGSMRDAISVLDRMLSAGATELTVEMIEQMLGLPRAQLIFDLVDKIGQADVPGALALVNSIIFNGMATDTLLASMIDHLRNLLVVRTCGIKSDLIEIYGVAPEALDKQASRFDPAVLTQDIVILEELRRAARQSQAGRALLDATIVRLALAEQFTPVAQLIDQAASAHDAEKKKDADGQPLSPAPAIPPLSVSVTPASPASRPSPALQAPALVNAASDSAVDDGDALPAVGKVWDTGPKRSLSEIFAAQAAKKAQPQEQAGPPAIAADLQPIWQSLLQRVQEQHGNAVYIPLISAQPRREGDVLVIRLTGPFAHIGKVLEKYRDQIQTLATEVAGAPLGIRLELDASAPAPVPTAAPGSAHRAGGPATNSPTQQSAISAAPARDGIPITPELRQELEKDPLIRSLLVEFNGTIVKVEQK